MSQARRVVVASLVGTSLEWYDFFLYGSAAALVFNKIFFPTVEPLTGTLLAFTTYAVGFVARPLGGIVFGHFGDRAGRKVVLIATLLVMGGSTFIIGLLPTYAQIGVAAPLLLVLMRFLQGLGLGGEWAGAVLMSMEHGRPHQRGFNASWPQVGVPVGNLLATGVLWVLSATLSDAAFLSWGWRVPFVLSGVLVFVGFWIRRTISESPLFVRVEQAGAIARTPLLDVLREHPRGLLVAMGARIGTDVAFYTFTLYVLTYVTGTVGLPRSAALSAVLIASACQLVLVPFFGRLSDRVGRRPVYLAGAVGAIAWAFAFFPLLKTGAQPLIVLAVVVALVTHAAMYGPQAAFVVELFATRVRYSGASMGYQIAGIFGGALAPIIAVKLAAATGSALAVSGYVAVALGVTVTALLFAPETADRVGSPAAEVASPLEPAPGTGDPAPRGSGMGRQRAAGRSST